MKFARVRGLCRQVVAGHLRDRGEEWEVPLAHAVALGDSVEILSTRDSVDDAAPAIPRAATAGMDAPTFNRMQRRSAAR